MKSTVTERTVGDVLAAVLDTANDTVFVVAPDAETVEGLVRAIDADSPTVRLLADTAALKAVTDDFSVAGRMANHVESGGLGVRRYDDGTNALVAGPSSVAAVVRGNDRVAGLVADDDTVVEDTETRLAEAWADAEAYDLRVPSLDRARETLEAELGRSTADDFDAILSSDAGDAIDEVTISLLAAAKNGELLYDISKWGEDVGIASKATFSRTKTRMEEQGVIETEKVPIDVGRPRLRLRLGSDRLDTDDDGTFARVARSMLS